MTRGIKFVGIPFLSLAAVSAIFGAGLSVGHAIEVQAMYITRPEYTKDQSALQRRQLADSLTLELTKQLIFTRLEQQSTEQARANRVLYRVACRLYPTECER